MRNKTFRDGLVREIIDSKVVTNPGIIIDYFPTTARGYGIKFLYKEVKSIMLYHTTYEILVRT